VNCLLCQHESREFSQGVFECSHCFLIFKDPQCFLSKDEDIIRYGSHLNSKEDEGYVTFLEKLILPLTTFLPEKFTALDFGCGPGPTLSYLLGKYGGIVENYDPLFYPDAHHLIPEFYDIVTSTEVVEHFKYPRMNWSEMIDLLKDNGTLAIMTQFFKPETNYESWWYKNDPTHIVFYQEETFNYLAREFQLEILYNDHKSVIIFKKGLDHV
jgi:hypothetical protein